MEIIDNSALTPRYLPDDQVNMEGWHPDWVKSLILAQLRVESATEEGTFQAAVRVLDHYQKMGVNAVWLTPIQDKGQTGNGYSNMGLHTVNPRLTGKDSYEESWQVVKWFVDEAHRRNIRVYIDLIVWAPSRKARWSPSIRTGTRDSSTSGTATSGTGTANPCGNGSAIGR